MAKYRISSSVRGLPKRLGAHQKGPRTNAPEVPPVSLPPARVIDSITMEFGRLSRNKQKLQAELLADLPNYLSGPAPASRFKMKQRISKIDEVLEVAHKTAAALQNMATDILKLHSKKAVDHARMHLLWTARRLDTTGTDHIADELKTARRDLRQSPVLLGLHGAFIEQSGLRSAVPALRRIAEEARAASKNRNGISQPLMQDLDMAVNLAVKAERIKIEQFLAEQVSQTRLMFRAVWYQAFIERIARHQQNSRWKDGIKGRDDVKGTDEGRIYYE